MCEVQVPGKIFCILCNGVVSFKNGDRSRFIGHMNHEHEAYLGLSFILAGCLMSPEERAAVETIMEEKYNSGMIEVKRSEEETSKEMPTENKVEDGNDLEESFITVMTAAVTEESSDENNSSNITNNKIGDIEEVKGKKAETEEDTTSNTSGQVKISMRSFLLENKSLLPRQEANELNSSKKPKNPVEIVKDKVDDKPNPPPKTPEVLTDISENKMAQQKASKKPRVTTDPVGSDVSKPAKKPDIISKEDGIEVDPLTSLKKPDISQDILIEECNLSKPPTKLEVPADVNEIKKSNSLVVLAFSCDLCTSSFKAASSLRRHIAKQHGDSVSSADKEVISDHVAPTNNLETLQINSTVEKDPEPQTPSRKSSVSHKCTKCDAKFKMEVSLEKHMKLAHPDPPIVKTKKEQVAKVPTPAPLIVLGPKLSVRTVESLNNSVQTSSSEKPSTPPKNETHAESSTGCTPSKDIKKETNVANQIGEDVKALDCNQCSKKFIMERNLNLHKKVAHGRAGVKKKGVPKVPKFNFTCVPCNIKFESKEHLEKHEKASHKKAGNEQISQDTSKKVSISKVSKDDLGANLDNLELSKVQVKTEPKEILQLPCSKCSVVFGNALALKKHNLKRHEEGAQNNHHPARLGDGDGACEGHHDHGHCHGNSTRGIRYLA